MQRLSRWWILGLCTFVLAGCRPVEREVTLTARAVLPADTFAGGPPSGAALTGPINGRWPPFDAQPVQGLSALMPLEDGSYRALADNGFGSASNSADFHLRWYELRPDWAAGSVELLGHTDLVDPDGHLVEAGAVLTGADLDPEAFALAPDGSVWVGDEHGPFVLRFDDRGHLLAPPLEAPLPAPLRGLGRGRDVLVSPDHPSLAALADDEARRAAANLPRSGGFEGLAAGPAGILLYALTESALLDDPLPTRRLLLEYDLKQQAWSGRYWEYHVDEPDHSVGELTAIGAGGFLVLERDQRAGEAARFKRVFRIDLARVANGGRVSKTPVADLLDLLDPEGLGGLAGSGYRFPYFTIEAVLPVSPTTLLLCNDNNYPFDATRRADMPDDTELIRIELPWPAAATR